jgi:hypothetical protein
VQPGIEAGHRKLSGFQQDVRFVGGKLRSICLLPALAEEGRGARVVQPGVVQHRESGVAEQVGPDVIVAGRIADLVHGEVVRLLMVEVDEIMCRAKPC